MSGIIKGSKKDCSGRKYTGSGPRPDHNETKRAEALERQNVWHAMSPDKQLADLDLRLGAGQGAVKQRARIKAALIQNKTQSVKPAAAAEPELVEPTRLKVKAKDRRAAEREHNVKQ